MASQKTSVSCEMLDDEHRAVLVQAIQNVLSTDLALSTFAQIVDGLPTDSTYRDMANPPNIPEHPLRLHTQICPGAEEHAQHLRDAFDATSLRYSPLLLESFSAARQTSKAFDLRLIELVAVSIHQIAVFLHRQPHLHDPCTTRGEDIQAVTDFKPPPPHFWAKFDTAPTMFFQRGFLNIPKYPDGIHDVVGYWAENRILGGIALFNRSMAWSDEEPEPNIYFESQRRGLTRRICQLLDSQQHDLLRFLKRDPGSAGKSTDKCPLPILHSMENRSRLDAETAVSVYKVYRDIWERTPPPPDTDERRRRSRDCFSEFDYPDLFDGYERIQKLQMKPRVCGQYTIWQYHDGTMGFQDNTKREHFEMISKDTVLPEVVQKGLEQIKKEAEEAACSEEGVPSITSPGSGGASRHSMERPPKETASNEEKPSAIPVDENSQQLATAHPGKENGENSDTAGKGR